MAQLDPLLNVIIEQDADALLLTEGERPAIRVGDALRPLSPRALNRAQIGHLLSELSDQIDAQRFAAGQVVTFSYTDDQGRPFDCQTGGNGQTLQATIRRAAEAPALSAVPVSMPAVDEPIQPSASPDPLGTSAAPAPSVPPAAVAAPSPVARVTPAGVEPRHPVDRILIQMIQEDCSDLHLCSGSVPIFRKDGDVVPAKGHEVQQSAELEELLAPIVPERNDEEFRECSDTDFAYEIPGLARFRINMFRDRKGVGAVFRQIPSTILTAEQLKIPDSILKLCALNKGLVLVTGPTGSGKSTTLAAMVDHINKTRSDHIITIEDPVEFVHENQRCLVNQREVHTHTGSFKRALRAALREDPDIVLVGELRDLETIEIAIETAETGHLVFGTLHTNTACSTVDRIIDQFPTDRQSQIRTMLSESLRGVVAQTLLKREGGGRVAALEVLVVTAAISNLIREGKTFQIPSLMQTGKNIGMQTMTDAMLALVKDKTVSTEEALRKAIEPSHLLSGFRKLNIQLPPGVG